MTCRKDSGLPEILREDLLEKVAKVPNKLEFFYVLEIAVLLTNSHKLMNSAPKTREIN